MSLMREVGRTLKPMMMACEAEASMMSDSEMAPVPPCTTLMRTFSVLCLLRASVMASRLPCTSALSTRLRVRVSWSEARRDRKVSRVTLDSLARSRSRCLVARISAMRRASFSSATAKNSSPASGTPSKPCTSTGMEGPASLTFLPWSFIRARTRPENWPHTKLSPWCRVPSWMSTVATGPRPLSSLASTMRPWAGLLGLALRSMISDCRATSSSRSSRP